VGFGTHGLTARASPSCSAGYSEVAYAECLSHEAAVRFREVTHLVQSLTPSKQYVDNFAPSPMCHASPN
jgi:hypothetical protein